MLIADKLTGQIIPLRFALFALVGGVELFVHMLIFWFALNVAEMAFSPAQASAAVLAMTSNFFINTFFTYRDRRLRGFAFYVICALGTVANVGIAGYIFSSGRRLMARRSCGRHRRISLELFCLFGLHLEWKNNTANAAL